VPGLRTSAASSPEGLTSGTIRHTESRTILSKTTGYLAEAGFTHSLTPARNCTFGCTYCYVPTLRVYGGLKPEDWQRWGQFTTFKSNAPELACRESAANQIVYCSPLVDPYQPAEASEALMPKLIGALLERPPAVFVIQTRGPLVLRDLPILLALSRRTRLRVSFSVTTNRDNIRKLYEPLCAPIAERLDVIRQLRAAGIETYATLAPLLPCDPEEFVRLSIEASGQDLIADPLHIRSVKRSGATTRDAAARIAAVRGHEEWFDAGFQQQVIDRMKSEAESLSRQLRVGPAGFGWLARME